MVADATQDTLEEDSSPGWAAFALVGMQLLQVAADGLDAEIYGIPLRVFVFAATMTLFAVLAVHRVIRKGLKPVDLIVLPILVWALVPVVAGPRLTDNELYGVPLILIVITIVVVPLLLLAIWHMIKGGAEGIAALIALVALIAVNVVDGAGLDDEVVARVQEGEALSFLIAISAATTICVLFSKAGGPRVWTAMCFGAAVSGLVLPWYLVAMPEFEAVGATGLFDFVRAPRSDIAMAIFLTAGDGGLMLLLVEHKLAPVGAGLLGLAAILFSLMGMQPFSGFRVFDTTLLAGFYVTLGSATTATALSFWLALRTLNPPPDPNVIPRMKEQFPRL